MIVQDLVLVLLRAPMPLRPFLLQETRRLRPFPLQETLRLHQFPLLDLFRLRPLPGAAQMTPPPKILRAPKTPCPRCDPAAMDWQRAQGQRVLDLPTPYRARKVNANGPLKF